MSQRTARIAVSLLCACALGMAYANSLGNGFHYDDSHSVLENPHVRHLGNIPSFFTDSARFSHMASRAMYRPLVLTSLSLNYWVGAYEPWGYQLVNLALHLMCTALVFALGRALGLRHLTAALSALLFGLHPVQAEVVNYVSSRSESLAALGYLLSLYCYALFARRSDSRPARRGLTYALSLAAFAFALLSKSTALSLPMALLVWDGVVWWRARRGLGHDTLPTEALPSPVTADRGGERDEDRGGRFDLRHHLPFWVVAGAYLVIVWTQAWKALGDPVRTLSVQLYTQIKAAAYYGFLLASPVQLSVEHQFSESTSLFSVPVIASGLLLASAAWVVVRLIGWGRFPSAVLPLAWAIVALLPSSVVPLNVLVNEHRLYLPLAFLSLLAGVVIDSRGLRGGRLRAPCIAALALLGLLTHQRNPLWADELSLWKDAAAKAPGMYRSHLHLGGAQQARGDLQGALQSFRTAAELAPNSPEVHYNRANVLRELRRLPEARRAYGQSLRANSAFALSLVNLSAMELEQGRADAALELLLRARQAEPGWAGEIHRRLGIARSAQGDSGGAEREYLAAIEFDESSAETHYNLANLYYNTGRSEQAARHYERALDLAPTSRKIYFNLADTYCAVGRYAEAEEVSDRGLRLAPSEVKLYYTLGVAQEGLGKLDAAIASYERFIASARESAAVMKNVRARLRDLKIAAPSR